MGRPGWGAFFFRPVFILMLLLILLLILIESAGLS